jgi:hypothetical protein
LPPTATTKKRVAVHVTHPNRAFLWLGIFGAPRVCLLDPLSANFAESNEFAVPDAIFSDTSFDMNFIIH